MQSPPHELGVVQKAVNHFLQEACKVLVISHDFSSFRAADFQAKSPMRRSLDKLNVSDVKRILEAKTVTSARSMALACGLHLARVKYEFP